MTQAYCNIKAVRQNNFKNLTATPYTSDEKK
jgi:hypothetical protein